MKKVLFTMVLVLGFGCATVYADNNNNGYGSGYDTAKNIDVKELPEHIQESLAIDYKNYLVKSADVEVVEEGVYVYTITLVDAENLETTVMYTDEVQEQVL